MKDDLQDWKQRTQRYWYVDGLSEIGAGAVILSVGILFGVSSLLSDHGLTGLLQSIGLPVLIIGLAVAARWLVRRLKETITYTRTGYIAYRRPEPRKRFSGILIAMITATAIGLVVTISSDWVDLRWLPAITGIFLALLTLQVAFRIRLTRLFILAGFPLVAGAVVALIGIPDPLNNALLFSSLGLGWLVSGLITLRRYLRSTTPADGTTIGEGNG